MQYLSEFLGAPVRDRAGRIIGRVEDLLVPVNADYPPLDALSLKTTGGEHLSVPWSQVRVNNLNQVSLTTALSETTPYQPSVSDLSLARQVLDRQIIDTNGIRVVRVNDLRLAESDGQYRLIGVDISTAGLVRRMGAAGILKALGVRLAPRTIAWEDIEPVESHSGGVQLRVPHEDLSKLHPSDMAAIISQLDQRHGQEVLEQLADETAADAMEEIDRTLQVALIKSMDPERAADILEEMEPDDAADLLGDLDPDEAQDLLRRMDEDEAEDVRELLAYDEECAGGLMTTNYVTVPLEADAAAAIQQIREQAAAMDEVYYVYVVDADERLLGTFSLRELIVADPSTPVSRVMRRELIRGRVDDSQEEVARLIARYNLLALPIVDDTGRLKGIVTVDDAMDVILPEDWKARVPRVYQHG